MGSPRIKGVGLRLVLDDVDRWADAVSVEMVNEAESVGLHRGGFAPIRPRWFFDVTAVQSTSTDSLWTYLFDHPFSVAGFTYAPHGNETPDDDHPHFVGTLQMPAPPAIGGEAGQDVTYTFDTRLNILTGPTKVTGPPPLSEGARHGIDPD